jgi:hypothetical protein
MYIYIYTIYILYCMPIFSLIHLASACLLKLARSCFKLMWKVFFWFDSFGGQEFIWLVPTCIYKFDPTLFTNIGFLNLNSSGIISAPTIHQPVNKKIEKEKTFFHRILCLILVIHGVTKCHKSTTGWVDSAMPKHMM